MIRYNDQNITEINDEDIKGILDSVPIIPLRNAVVFPGIVLPVFVGRNESIKLVENFSQAPLLLFLLRKMLNLKKSKTSKIYIP